jgi:CBS domain-containing protein
MTSVREVMTTKVTVLYDDLTLSQATEIMTSNGVSGAPVVNGSGEFVGILSESDILDFAKCTEGQGFSSPSLTSSSLPYERVVRNETLCSANEKVGGAKVRDAMNEEVVTIGPEDDVDKALETMVRFDIDQLPVVVGEKLVGVIARQDAMWSKCRQSIEKGEAGSQCEVRDQKKD